MYLTYKAELRYPNVYYLLILLFFRRVDESLAIVHISDISPSGSKPTEETWTLSMLKENISSETISLIKFNFLDLQVPQKTLYNTM